MHVVATNLCVWIRILVRECFKEITKHSDGYSEDYLIKGVCQPFMGRVIS